MVNKLLSPRGWGLAAMLLLLLLGGCASTVTTQVTAFHDENVFDGQRTFAFEHTKARDNNLEQKTYEGWLRDRLDTEGFSERSARDAHYLIGMNYGVRQQFVRVSQPVYDPMFGPAVPWGPWYRPWGFYDPWYWGPPMYVQTSVPVAVKWLDLRFLERSSGKEVYRVSSQTTDGGSLASAMPYLINAAFSQLPLPSGRTMTVEEKVQK